MLPLYAATSHLESGKNNTSSTSQDSCEEKSINSNEKLKQNGINVYSSCSLQGRVFIT